MLEVRVEFMPAAVRFEGDLPPRLLLVRLPVERGVLGGGGHVQGCRRGELSGEPV